MLDIHKTFDKKPRRKFQLFLAFAALTIFFVLSLAQSRSISVGYLFPTIRSPHVSLDMTMKSVVARANDVELKNGKTETLSVDSGRPLAEAITILEVRFGSAITYEDPPYAYAGDISDVTNTVRRDLDKFKPGKAPRVLVPKGGKFDFIVLANADRVPDQGRTLERLLHDYEATSKSARFRLEATADTFHVIPIAARNAFGRLEPKRPILDAKLTLSEKERTGLQEIRDFCAEVTRVTGVKTVMGTVPTALASYRQRYGVTNAVARTTLAEILQRAKAGQRLSWRLLYDPGMKMYVLNIHAVEKR